MCDGAAPVTVREKRKSSGWHNSEAVSLCLTYGQISLRGRYLFYKDTSPRKCKLKAELRNPICIGWHESSLKITQEKPEKQGRVIDQHLLNFSDVCYSSQWTLRPTWEN